MFGARPVATQMLMKLCMETMLPTPQHMIFTGKILGPQAHTNTFKGDQKQQQYDQSTADKSVLLSSHRKNKVGLILRNKVSIITDVTLVSITESTSHKLSGGDGCF
mgnify:CR=1 FL=1